MSKLTIQAILAGAVASRNYPIHPATTLIQNVSHLHTPPRTWVTYRADPLLDKDAQDTVMLDKYLFLPTREEFFMGYSEMLNILVVWLPGHAKNNKRR